MNESGIVKFLCANQGSFKLDDLVFNLGPNPSDILNVISNQDKFAYCSPFGQQKVVARSKLRLCRARGCPGACGGLHLCKSVLFGDSCQSSESRRECTFCHELDSDHNQKVLKDSELESLSERELCTLMLQSDDRLLPQLCHDYRNGLGESGQCKGGCKRLHICEMYMNRDCSCLWNHDFRAPQPLKILQDYGVPDEFIGSLRSVYGNILALKYSDYRGDKGSRDSHQKQGGYRGNRANQSSRQPGPSALHAGGPFVRGRGGPRGGRGNWPRSPRTHSVGDISTFGQMDLDGPGDTGLDGDDADQQQVDLPVSTANMDTSSEGGRDAGKTQTLPSAAAGGSGGNRQPTHSSNDASAAAGGASGGDNGPSRRERQRPVRDKTEICLFFIKGSCKHEEERCYKAHVRMPYRWEIREEARWTPMPENETIEKDYCDPSKTSSSSSPSVCFATMTSGPDGSKVRRLSTTSSLLEPTFIHTTEWVWYWEDELGTWNEYASTADGQKSADTDSAALEQRFLDNNKEVVEFSAGSQTYSLSFQDMKQTNKQYGTQKAVRRRPRFASAADVQARRVRKPFGQMSAVPSHWDQSRIPPSGYQRISLQHSSEEFKRIESLFRATMKGFDVVNIERIQNRGLWQFFQWYKTQMQNSSGGRRVREEKLFHGTDGKHVDAICKNNFDWRICGTHGTAFGRGSYFARDARYSHSYTGDSDVKSMFVAHLLVGEYTKGSPGYVRAPPKHGSDVNFFHSCVDDVSNPSVYVVFDTTQIYPEYLLQYKATPPVVQPTSTSYRPSVSVSNPTSTSYRPSASVSNPTSSSYRPSASVSNPTSTSYRPSASVSNPTSSSDPLMFSPPAGNPKKQSDSCIIA
ncbi:protein mono-ADP-ribosyltransferase PARP12 [Brachionichthys hirsutus]|uniref:protein mono-ADP-ribosyltransferase PARP12 n=1 Tax=Brachionichthys hirsutus TaxID=412623 RepID=UPI003604B3A5